MMERITSFILVTALGRQGPARLRNRISVAKGAFAQDHGPEKVDIASERVLGMYDEILRQPPPISRLQEEPLLRRLLQELLDDSAAMDGEVVDLFRRMREVLDAFSRETSPPHWGAHVRGLYKELHVAGPYFVDVRFEDSLREIARDLTLLYKGVLLFDIVKTPKFLGGSSSREFSGASKGAGYMYGETFLVPDIDPKKWTVKSRARVPLALVSFPYPLDRRHLQVLLLDPKGETSEARYVHQQFLRRCRQVGIRLEEVLLTRSEGERGSGQAVT